MSHHAVSCRVVLRHVIAEFQCWSLSLPVIDNLHPNAPPRDDDPPPPPPLPPPSLDARISTALQLADPVIAEFEPGISNAIRSNTTIEIIKNITSHPALPSVARIISDTIELAGLDTPWTECTRDELVRAVEGKVSDLSGYNLKHLVRSLSYVHQLDTIPCGITYYNMSLHNDKAIEQLETGEITPSMIIMYMRADDDDLGIITNDILPDEDMVLELVICQAMRIWKGIHDGIGAQFPKPPVYELHDLATSNDVLVEIYWRVWSETIGNGDSGISHAASAAYEKLAALGIVRPSSFIALPPIFKDSFLPLVKALLLSRVIVKSPLSNASDIRALQKAKVAFEGSGYEGADLAKLLIVTHHRLWTSKRMERFVAAFLGAY